MTDDYRHKPVTVEGKTTVVIGGTSGIGEAIALGFACEGADVVATSRSEDRVRETTTKLRDRGSSTLAQTCDVTDHDSLEYIRDEVWSNIGAVDVLVVSAGAVSRDDLLTIEESEWDRVLDVQLDGVYRAMQVFGQRMESGSIIPISSIAAELSVSNLPAYSAAKAGANGLVRAAAREFAPEIRVNAIAPGFVITPQNEDTYAKGTENRAKIDERTPLSRVAEREEITGAAIYLASDASSYTTGEILTVDGGFSRSAL